MPLRRALCERESGDRRPTHGGTREKNSTACIPRTDHATNAKHLSITLNENEHAEHKQDEPAAGYAGLEPLSPWSGLPR